MIGIDIDVTNEDEAAAVEAIVVEVLGPTPLRRVGRWPKVALVYRQSEPMYKSVAARQPGEGGYVLEYLARGAQFLAFAIHPDTQAPYSWGDATPCNTRVADVPVVTIAQLDELARRVAERWGAKPTQVPLDTFGASNMNPLPAGAPPTADPVFAELTRRGMVTSVRPNDDGWYVTLCPQAHLHTDGDPHAGYWPGRPGAHHCFHAHCDGFGRGRLKQWLTENPTSDGVVPDLRDPPRPIVSPPRDVELLRRALGRGAQAEDEDEDEAGVVADSRPRILLLSGDAATPSTHRWNS